MPDFMDTGAINMRIAVLSGKGGTGKTLVSVNLAAAAKASTYIDCDVEEPNGHLFFKPEGVQDEEISVKIPKVDHVAGKNRSYKYYERMDLNHFFSTPSLCFFRRLLLKTHIMQASMKNAEGGITIKVHLVIDCGIRLIPKILPKPKISLMKDIVNKTAV
jgi:cellulose biosynthesis protein BcsQ